MSSFQDFGPVVSRLIETLGDEKAALQKRDYIALADICERKVRCLIELNSFSGSVPLELNEAQQLAIAEARHRLQESESLLRIHIHAAGAVSAMIRDAMDEHTSDGTYSPLLYKQRLK